MKKFIWGVSLLLISFSVRASEWDISKMETYIMDSEILENIDCDDKVCTGTYLIPSDYSKDEIKIVPTVFMVSTSNAMPGDTYEFKIVVKNESNYDYTYLSNSFYVKPMNCSDVTSVISYAGNNINTGGVMYRINSSKALMSLYDTNKKLNNEELSDESLDKQLIKKGYQGIRKLDQFIKDYIGYPNDDLEYHTEEVEKALWPNISEMPTVKESNPVLIKFGYDYFYNVLFSMHVSKNDLDNKVYAIGNWERDSDVYQGVDNLLTPMVNKKQESNYGSLYFHINGPLTRNPYVLFEFGLDFGFKLNKVTNEEEAIIPAINDDIDNNMVDEQTNYVDTGVESNILLIIILCFSLLVLFIILKRYLNRYVKEN